MNCIHILDAAVPDAELCGHCRGVRNRLGGRILPREWFEHDAKENAAVELRRFVNAD